MLAWKGPLFWIETSCYNKSAQRDSWEEMNIRLSLQFCRAGEKGTELLVTEASSILGAQGPVVERLPFYQTPSIS